MTERFATEKSTEIRIPTYDSFGDIDEAQLWISDRFMSIGSTIDVVIDYMSTDWFVKNWREDPNGVIRDVYERTK